MPSAQRHSLTPSHLQGMGAAPSPLVPLPWGPRPDLDLWHGLRPGPEPLDRPSAARPRCAAAEHVQDPDWLRRRRQLGPPDWN